MQIKGRTLAVLLTAMVSSIPTRGIAQTNERLLTIEPYFGGMFGPDDKKDAAASEPDDKFRGLANWQAGASVFVFQQARWLGFVGNYAHEWNDALTVSDVAGGVRVYSPFLVNSDGGGRVYAHALAGNAWAAGPGSLSGPRTSPEFVVGGAFDVILMRFQVDYVRRDLGGIPQNGVRALFGGGVPLCFRGLPPG